MHGADRTLRRAELYLHTVTLSVTVMTLLGVVNYLGREQIPHIRTFVEIVGGFLDPILDQLLSHPNNYAPGYATAFILGLTLWITIRVIGVVLLIEICRDVISEGDGYPRVGLGLIAAVSVIYTANAVLDLIRGIVPAIGVIPISELLEGLTIPLMILAVVLTIAAANREQLLDRRTA